MHSKADSCLFKAIVSNIYSCFCSHRVRTFPKESVLLGRDTVRALMYYALKVWSDIAPLNFHEVAGNEADIQIDFTKADHNDGYPFDGPGGTVAHAFFPGERFTAGDTHFDDDEAWTFRSPGKKSLFIHNIFSIFVYMYFIFYIYNVKDVKCTGRQVEIVSDWI
ncbi:hypothetical protein PO909_007899 [Leuciscus waleckii]